MIEPTMIKGGFAYYGTDKHAVVREATDKPDGECDHSNAPYSSLQYDREAYPNRVAVDDPRLRVAFASAVVISAMGATHVLLTDKLFGADAGAGAMLVDSERCVLVCGSWSKDGREE
jgi:hypothetical protein